jgi:hypothetical protein
MNPTPGRAARSDLWQLGNPPERSWPFGEGMQGAQGHEARTTNLTQQANAGRSGAFRAANLCAIYTALGGINALSEPGSVISIVLRGAELSWNIQ